MSQKITGLLPDGMPLHRLRTFPKQRSSSGISTSMEKAFLRTTAKRFGITGQQPSRVNAMAENNLAAMYEDGRGTSKNAIQAFHWYLVSSKAGNPVAQCNLASMYFFGSGIQPDHQESVRWFRAAAEQGIGDAQTALAVMYYKGTE